MRKDIGGLVSLLRIWITVLVEYYAALRKAHFAGAEKAGVSSVSNAKHSLKHLRFSRELCVNMLSDAHLKASCCKFGRN
ncbi:hypothetical protein [Marivivens marinus]|uniref:hypothetical protein n=1 Tax=Marivivens marinus TaxID=3110173 RepID=UPI003B847D2E